MSSSSSPPAVPPELKPITPYLARAHELNTADPVIAYWCTYFAVQQAMTLGAKEADSQMFLFGIMDKLEAMKADNEDNEAVTDDGAASAYIENFGLKIFATADNEDRKGKSTRATARKFLAAANFLELLSVFGDLGIDNREKIKYSKWKATDIAKAFREGRTPIPGPAGGLPEVEDPATQVNSVTREEEKELKKEFEELVSTNLSTTTEREEQGETQSEPAYPFPQQPTTLPSAPPLPQSDEEEEEEEEEEEQDSSRIQTPSLPTFIDNDDNNNDTSTSDTPTNTTVDPSSSVPPTPSVLPTSHQTSTLPTPSFHPPSQPPAFPSVVFPPPQPQAQFPEPQLPPPATTSHSQRQEIFNSGGTTTTRTTIPPPPPPTIITTTMDPLEISQVQKHAKWAISALNYEDFDTARKELRLALQMLGG